MLAQTGLFLFILGAFAYLLTGSTLSAQPIPTAAPTGSYVIAGSVYVRGGPGESFLPVGSLARNDRLFPVGRNEASNWILLAYNTGFGWIRADLAVWDIDLQSLPVITDLELTPAAALTPNVREPLPTATPDGNWIDVGQQGAFIRTGPGLTYPVLGVLYDGDLVEPVSRSNENSWVLIRFGDGFGWISRPLVRWNVDLRSLPVMQISNLTPSATWTKTATPTASQTATTTHTTTITVTTTLTPTDTAVPTATPTETRAATSTPSPSPTAAVTSSVTPSETPSVTPSVTASAAPTWAATVTPSSSETATDVPTSTAAPTEDSSPAAAVQAVLTEIPSPTADTPSPTPAPSATPSQTETQTLTSTVAASATATVTRTPNATITPSSTPVPPTTTSTNTATLIVLAVASAATASPSPTVLPSETASVTSSATVTQAVTATPTAAAIALAVQPTSVRSIDSGETTPATSSGGARLPIEMIAGVGLMLALGAYAAFYWRGAQAADRYRDGFFIEHCPVCRRGNLVLETKRARVLGIPRPRHTVHCTHCRSVLREAGKGRWRYAVDPIDNPTLYAQLNGQILDDGTLIVMAARALDTTIAEPMPRTLTNAPEFIDDED